MCRYAKAVIGRVNRSGESLVDLVCECLELTGVVRGENEGKRKFVARHASLILAVPRTQVARKRAVATGPNVGELKVDPASDEFLQTYQWRAIRMVVLKRDGAVCACCGASPSTGAVMNVDHIKPRKRFPELALDANNLQVLCGDCNHGKGNWDMTDWRKPIKAPLQLIFGGRM